MKKRKKSDKQAVPDDPQAIAERARAQGVPEEDLQGPPAPDWQRAAMVGEEAPGGTVATPDQDVVDEIGEALGVPRAPDEEFRPSTEILEGRDRDRWAEEEEEGGT